VSRRGARPPDIVRGAVARRRVVAFAVELVRRMDLRARLQGGPARPADMHALIRAVDELRGAEEQAAHAACARGVKYNELPDRDTTVGDEACPACGRLFEQEDDVTYCADCTTCIHVACVFTHFWRCPRRQN